MECMSKKKQIVVPQWTRKVMTVTALSAVVLQPASVLAEASLAQSFTSQAVEAKVPASDGAQKTAAPVAKITKEQAIDIVKKLFPQFKDFTVSNVQLGDMNSYPPQYQNVWSIQWQYTIGNSGYGFNSKVDSITGDLLQTHYYVPNRDQNETYYPPKYSREEALTLAKAFIKKASPTIAENTLRVNDTFMKQVPRPLFGPVQYYFSFNIDINGVRSPADILYITVDGNGNINSYNRNIAGDTYPSAVPALSPEDASKAYENAVNITLQYIPVYKISYRDRTWMLAWAPRLKGDISIDAQTGEYLDETGNKVDTNAALYEDVDKKENVFTPTQGSENGQLTAEQAAKIVEQTLNIPSEKKLANQNMRSGHPFSGNPDGKVWDLSWMEPPQKPQSFPTRTNAAVDAKTGQILEYRQDSFGPPWMQPEKPSDSKASISKEEARNKAMEFINLLYPSASDELKLVAANPNQKVDEKNFNFQFQRFYKGIPVNGEAVTLSLDSSGKLFSYYTSPTSDLSSVLKDKVENVTQSEAKAKFLEQTVEQLQYRRFGGFLGADGSYEPFKVKLVYARVHKDEKKTGYVLDATTGEWKPSFFNIESASTKPGQLPSDISEHWAQDDLSTLFHYGVIKVDDAGLVHPDAELTLGDWMNMMSAAVNPSYETQVSFNSSANPISFPDVDAKSPYYAASQLYIQLKWLDPKTQPALQPEQPLTREVLANNLIHLVKYDKLAGLVDQQNANSFQDRDDIDAANLGDVILAVQLGLLNATADNGFEPKRKVTKAEAAVVLMRLVKLQGKLDQAISQ